MAVLRRPRGGVPHPAPVVASRLHRRGAAQAPGPSLQESAPRRGLLARIRPGGGGVARPRALPRLKRSKTRDRPAPPGGVCCPRSGPHRPGHGMLSSCRDTEAPECNTSTPARRGIRALFLGVVIALAAAARPARGPGGRHPARRMAELRRRPRPHALLAAGPDSTARTSTTSRWRGRFAPTTSGRHRSSSCSRPR